MVDVRVAVILSKKQRAGIQRYIADGDIVLDQRDAGGQAGTRLIHQMNEGARAVVARHVRTKNDNLAGIDRQAVAAGHHLVLLGAEQDVAVLQRDRIGTAEGDRVADEMQAVDDHFGVRSEGLQVHEAEDAAVGTGRFEYQVRIGDREHVTALPGVQSRNLAVGDITVGREEDADITRQNSNGRGGLGSAATAVADLIDKAIGAIETCVRRVDERPIGTQYHLAARRAADRCGVDGECVTVEVAVVFQQSVDAEHRRVGHPFEGVVAVRGQYRLGIDIDIERTDRHIAAATAAAVAQIIQDYLNRVGVIAPGTRRAVQVLDVRRVVQVSVQIGDRTPQRDIRRTITGDGDTAAGGSGYDAVD